GRPGTHSDRMACRRVATRYDLATIVWTPTARARSASMASPQPGARELPLERALHYGELILGESLLIRNVNTDTLVPVVANAVPWRDSDGQIDGAVTTLREVIALEPKGD